VRVLTPRKGGEVAPAYDDFCHPVASKRLPLSKSVDAWGHGQMKMKKPSGRLGESASVVKVKDSAGWEPPMKPSRSRVLKPGMDSQQLIARFEAERQALAIMVHPNIAKMFEAGST
jgi:hypothetical protein